MPPVALRQIDGIAVYVHSTEDWERAISPYLDRCHITLLGERSIVTVPELPPGLAILSRWGSSALIDVREETP